MSEVYNKLLEIGFLTGSRAYSTNKDDADYDIVYSVSDASIIRDLLETFDKTPSDYFAGYYIKDGNKLINLIPVHPHDFLPWYLATQAMRVTLKRSNITNCINKYSVFMGMVSLFKGNVEQLGSLKSYDNLKDDILSGRFKGV